jgi:hypothetical protein
MNKPSNSGLDWPMPTPLTRPSRVMGRNSGSSDRSLRLICFFTGVIATTLFLRATPPESVGKDTFPTQSNNVRGVATEPPQPRVQTQPKATTKPEVVVVYKTVPSYPHVLEADYWKPIASECKEVGNTSVADPFPPTFDLELYQEENSDDTATNSDGSAVIFDESHYLQIGRHLGHTSTSGQSIREIINQDILPHLSPALELGPFTNPILLKADGGAEVKYFDVLDQQALLERAGRVGYPVINSVPIDYVSPNGDLASVPDKGTFQMILSSHVLEHQLSLVYHLNAVASLLTDDGGYYLAIVPDKRYCFDHYVSESSIADVLDDFENQRHNASSHSLRSLIETRTMTHNSAQEHWKSGEQQNHGPRYKDKSLFGAAMQEFREAKESGKYLDVHNYQFVPQGLAHIVDMLYEMGLTKLRVHRLYETVLDHFEFGIVLKKC